MCLTRETVETRREFFRAGARYALLGVIAAAGWFAGRRNFVPGQACVNRGICSGCREFDRCGLPQALSAKQVKGRA
jgi:hypothetical protein